MKTWTRADLNRLCGGPCGGTVKAGEPVLVIEIRGVQRRRVRCRACAGEPVNWDQIQAGEQARAAIVERAAEAFTSVRQIASGSSLPFDARMAAAGRDDD